MYRRIQYNELKSRIEELEIRYSKKRATTHQGLQLFLFSCLSKRKAYFTLATIALKASGLFKARSASTLRLISIPALASLPMSAE